MPDLVYFSNVSGNTHRFVNAVGRPALRLPIRAAEDVPTVTEPFVLVLPTYGGGAANRTVPRPVVKFLNIPENAELLRGVIGGGNLNFGEDFCRAAHIVSARFSVPLLYRFEIFGTPDDHVAVRNGLESFWKAQPSA